jgi:hypothetical protein
MAVFQLSAGITALVGSSGGTTFKRNKSANVWMNKSRGASRGRNLQNIRLSNNASIFKSWSLLPAETRAAWNANAAATKVKDKFGNDVNISGVAFQRKCELSGVLVGATNIDPTVFTTDLAGITIETAEMEWGNHFDVELVNNSGFSSYFVLMVQFSQNDLNAPQFTRRGIFFAVEVPSGNHTSNVASEMLEKYPFLNANYNLRLYGYEINPTGWSGVMTSKNVTVI